VLNGAIDLFPPLIPYLRTRDHKPFQKVQTPLTSASCPRDFEHKYLVSAKICYTKLMFCSLKNEHFTVISQKIKEHLSQLVRICLNDCFRLSHYLIRGLPNYNQRQTFVSFPHLITGVHRI